MRHFLVIFTHCDSINSCWKKRFSTKWRNISLGGNRRESNFRFPSVLTTMKVANFSYVTSFSSSKGWREEETAVLFSSYYRGYKVPWWLNPTWQSSHSTRLFWKSKKAQKQYSAQQNWHRLPHLSVQPLQNL